MLTASTMMPLVATGEEFIKRTSQKVKQEDDDLIANT
jgi:hypothetical protein